MEPIHRRRDVAEAELTGNRPLLGVLQAPVLGELGVPDPVSEGGEQAAGVDLRKLFGVADEDDLRSPIVGLADHLRQAAGPDHPCLVDLWGYRHNSTYADTGIMPKGPRRRTSRRSLRGLRHSPCGLRSA